MSHRKLLTAEAAAVSSAVLLDSDISSWKRSLFFTAECPKAKVTQLLIWFNCVNYHSTSTKASVNPPFYDSLPQSTCKMYLCNVRLVKLVVLDWKLYITTLTFKNILYHQSNCICVLKGTPPHDTCAIVINWEKKKKHSGWYTVEK